MAIGTILGLISLLSALVSGASNVNKSIKEGEAEKDQEDYANKVKKFNEKEQAKAERERRRQALMRAIGSDVITKPQSAAKPPEAPEAPDYTANDITSGISNVVGQGASMAGGMLDKKTPDTKNENQTTAGLPKTVAPKPQVNPMTQQGSFDLPQDDTQYSLKTDNKYKRFADRYYRYDG